MSARSNAHLDVSLWKTTCRPGRPLASRALVVPHRSTDCCLAWLLAGALACSPIDAAG
jgi:hypothetical protein